MKRQIISAGLMMVALFIIGAGCSTNKKATFEQIQKEEELAEIERQKILKEVKESAPTVPADKEVYQNNTYNFTLQYPRGWTKQEPGFGTIVTIFSPFEDDNDDFQENIGIARENLTGRGNVTADQYADATIAQLQQLITGFTLISSYSTLLSGYPAKRVEYAGSTGDGQQLQWLQIFMVKDSQAYIFTYVAAFDQYYKFLDLAGDAANSLIVR